MRHSFSLMTAVALCLSAQICWAECSGPAVDKDGDGNIDYCEAFCLSTRECCAAVGGDPDTCCQMPGQKWVDGECQERTPADYECCDIWFMSVECIGHGGLHDTYCACVCDITPNAPECLVTTTTDQVTTTTYETTTTSYETTPQPETTGDIVSSLFLGDNGGDDDLTCGRREGICGGACPPEKTCISDFYNQGCLCCAPGEIAVIPRPKNPSDPDYPWWLER